MPPLIPPSEEIPTVEITRELRLAILAKVDEAIAFGALDGTDVSPADVADACERILSDDPPPQFQKWPVGGPKRLPAGPAQSRFVEALIHAAVRGLGKAVPVALKDSAPNEGEWTGQLDGDPGRFPQLD